ncbi:hypothetical protein AALO_G00003950 [Alosa alosa]|uniref:Rad21/Rec8-like protein C-terminal eukaryotic domain-containing protein n=2 Tax=Alosa alosa TaxID=278164 RepID=A0AAV6HJ41_9TELE|nr:hypothetical protein AALO_G00003950 [Alosa alosa]
MDPLFGVVDYGLPSPSSYMQMFSAEFPDTSMSMHTDGFIASPESITLREQEPLMISQDEFQGVELQVEGLVEMLLEQPDNFIEGMIRDQQMETERSSPLQDQEQVRQAEAERGQDTGQDTEQDREQEREVERAAEMEKTRDMAASTMSTDQLQVTASISSKEPTILLEEGVITPMAEAYEISEERTPMSVPLPSPSSVGSRPREERTRQRIESPSLEVLELPPVVRRRRRRQLIFVDERTQIHDDEQRAQIDNVHIETRPLAEVLVDVRTLRTATPDALLSNPCYDLPQDILEIWRRGAAPRSSLAAWGEVEMEASEEEQEERELGRREMEEGRVEVERESDALEIASDRELSSKDISATSLPHPEIPREFEHSLSQEGSGVSVHSLELSDKDMSQLEPIGLPRSPVRPMLGHLEDIPEEIPEPFEDALRMFFQPLEMQDEVTFQSLLPPSPSRETVAGSFWYLLENVNQQRVIVHQDEPYGDIFVSRGLLFDQIW